jgi:hypothetical protein
MFVDTLQQLSPANTCLPSSAVQAGLGAFSVRHIVYYSRGVQEFPSGGVGSGAELVGLQAGWFEISGFWDQCVYAFESSVSWSQNCIFRSEFAHPRPGVSASFNGLLLRCSDMCIGPVTASLGCVSTCAKAAGMYGYMSHVNGSMRREGQM